MRRAVWGVDITQLAANSRELHSDWIHEVTNIILRDEQSMNIEEVYPHWVLNEDEFAESYMWIDECSDIQKVVRRLYASNISASFPYISDLDDIVYEEKLSGLFHPIPHDIEHGHSGHLIMGIKGTNFPLTRTLAHQFPADFREHAKLHIWTY